MSVADGGESAVPVVGAMLDAMSICQSGDYPVFCEPGYVAVGLNDFQGAFLNPGLKQPRGSMVNYQVFEIVVR